MVGRDGGAGRGPAPVREGKPQDDAKGHAHDRGDRERAAEPATPHVEGEQEGRDGPIHEQQRAQQHAPADGAEEPLAEEQQQPDPEEERGKDEDPDGCADERDHPLDLLDDLGQLRLREVDVGPKQALPGRKRRPELGPQSARGLRARFTGRHWRPCGVRRGVVHATSTAF